MISIRVEPPSGKSWSYVAAFVALWVSASTLLHQRKSSESSFQKAVHQRRFQITAAALATAGVVCGLSIWAFRFGSADRDPSLPVRDTGALPALNASGRDSGSALVQAQLSSFPQDSWHVSRVWPLTDNGNMVGFAAEVSVTGVQELQLPGLPKVGLMAAEQLVIWLDLHGVPKILAREE